MREKDRNADFQRSSPTLTKVPVFLPDLSVKYSSRIMNLFHRPGEKSETLI